MKTAISYLTAEKPELVAQSLPPLIEGARASRYHLFVYDGSTNEASQKTLFDIAYPTAVIHSNVCGGAGAAIVFALTKMLQHEEEYDVVGLVENDVLLGGNWLDCLDLFSRGAADGLSVGAVSARAYEDRVLFQRDGYAVCHNLGAGMILLTRQAARIILDNFRTMWTSDNRRIFAQLCGVDIGQFWAFRLNEQFTTADWGWDATLAAHGLASLALTPSPVEMIGQNGTLAEQGLTIVKKPRAIDTGEPLAGFKATQSFIRMGDKYLGVDTKFHYDVPNATWTYFPHQIAMLGGAYLGDWRFEECRGWGTFKWVSGALYGDTMGNVGFKREDGLVIPQGLEGGPTLIVPVFGACSILVSGGKSGGKVEIIDEQSGFRAAPDLPPEGEQGQVAQVMVPGGLVYRNIRVSMLTPGCAFYGIQTREKQPFLPNVSFDHSALLSP